MTILQIFRKDRKFWNESEKQQVELFFMLHPFFSKFYQHQDFDKVVNFTFYSCLQQNEQMRLQVNKKSQLIILLEGQIKIYRKILENQNKKKLIKKENDVIYDQYIKMGEFRDSYQAKEIRNDVIIKSKPSVCSQFLFIPTMLYQAHNYIVHNRRIERLVQVLSKAFSQASKRDIKILAESGCIFKQYKINGFIYKAGSVPQYCYILISGNIKIQSCGFSAKKMLDMSIIGENAVFGDRDLGEEGRIHNAICCSSHCKVLMIKKEPYNKFIAKNRHINPSYAKDLKTFIGQKRNVKTIMEKYEQKSVLPRILRFHSFAKPQQEQEMQNNILENCHILLNLSSHKRSKSSFRLPEHIQRDYSVNQFQKKVNLFKRRKIGRPLDLTNKLF